MDDDFRIIVSAKSRCAVSKGATGLHDLFKEDIEELGLPDPDWYTDDVIGVPTVNSDNEKKVPESDEFPSHSSSMTDKDGISPTVRNLLDLIVKRASGGTSRSDEAGFELSHDEDKTMEADESWTSSMATPSKTCYSFTEVDHSPDTNLNLTISNIQHGNTSFELARRLSNEEGRESLKTGFLFYGVEEPVIEAKINSHNPVHGLIIDPIDSVSLSNNVVDAVKSSCLPNFLTPSITVLPETKQDNLIIKTSAGEPSESQYYGAHNFPGNDKDCEGSDLAATDIVIGKNAEPSIGSGCNFGEHTVRSTYLNAVITSEEAHINSLSSDCVKTEVLCTVNEQAGMKVSPLSSERTLQQIRCCELESWAENFQTIEDPKTIGTCAEISSFKLEASPICQTALQMHSVNKMKESEGSDAVMDKNNSNCENRQLDKVLDLVCSPGKNKISFPDDEHKESGGDFDGTRNSKEEPEYVTQILNLLCSPINLPNSNGRKRQREIVDDVEAEVKKSCQDKESVCIARELMEELGEKIQHRLEEVKVNSLISGHIIDDVDKNLQDKVVKHSVNNHHATECEHVITDHEGVKLEKNSHGSWDKDLIINACTNISLKQEKEQLSDACSTGENLNKRSLGQELIISSFREHNVSTVASNKEISDATGWCSRKNVVSEADVTLTKVGLSNAPRDDRNVLHSPHSERVVTSDPQPCPMGSVEIKTEPENERDTYLNYLGTQDFLSCSVLEEVCQASEALVYIGKMKNDGVIGQDSKTELKSSGECSNLSEEKIEVDNGCMTVRTFVGKENLNQAEEIIEASADYWSSGPSVSRSTLPPWDKGKGEFACRTEGEKITPGGERYCSYQEEKKSCDKSVKKKIVFTIPGCCEINEMGNWLNNGDEEYPEVLMETPQKCSRLSLSSSSNVNSSCSTREKCVASTSHKDPKQFVYPKQGSQRGSLLPKGLLPEDLMSTAAQLEKHSSLVSNNDKSILERLKTRSLVSFTSLEPIECDHNTIIKNKITDGERKVISLRNQSLIDQDKSVKVVKCNEMPEEIKDNILALNKTELGRVVVQVVGTKNLDKKAVVKLIDNTCEVLKDPELTEVTQVDMWKSLAIADGCTHNVVAKGSEENIEIDERDNICTSPILTKHRKKKSFIRRNKRKFKTSTPMTKKKITGTMKELSSTTVYTGEKVNYIEKEELNNDRIVEDNLSITAAEDDVEIERYEIAKTGEYDFSPQRESMMELSVPIGACTEIFHSQKYHPLLKNELLFENEDSLTGVGLQFSTASRKEKDSPSRSLLKANMPSCEDSTSVRSDAFGFSTSGGKKVNVSEISLTKAKKLFSEGVQSLRGGNDLGVLITDGGKKLDVSKPNMLLSCEDSTPVRSGAVGFSTASGKKVTVSEGSLNKAKQLFSEGAESLEVKDVLSGISLAKGNEVDASSKSLLRPEFVGFSSASGKKVSVSEKSVARAKKLFSEDAASLSIGGNELGHSTATGYKTDISAKPLLMAKVLSCQDSTPVRSGAVGFSTASGKKVTVSEGSLNKAKQLFSESAESLEVKDVLSGISLAKGNEVDASSKSLLRPEFVGFSSASGKKVSVSEKSVAHAKKLFSEDAASLSIGGNELGHSTATGYKTDISAKPLLMAKVLSCQDSTPVRSGAVGFSTASGKKVTVSEGSLNKAKQLFSESAESLEVKDVLSGISLAKGNEVDASSKSLLRPEFVGFSSASGKKVSVSEKSVAHAKKLFSEDAASLSIGGNELGHSTATGYKTDISAKPLLMAKVLSCQDSTPVRSGAVGFSTASGKKVTVSEGSLNKAKQLFSESAESLEVKDVLSGISLAKGNEVDASSKSLLRPEFVGFSSASGKKVSVSEKSVARAKKLFSEDAASLSIGGNELGHSTATGYKTDISAKPLLMAKVLSCQDSTPVRSGAVGFSTASGKKVTVSEGSLNKAKKLFAEHVQTLEEGDLSFSNVSEKTLDVLKPKMLLSCENSTPVSSDPIEFSTASGRKVAASESSLTKAKKLFGDDAGSLGVDDITGFSSVSANKIDVLSKSLLKSYMPSCEDSTPVRSDAVGFSTASNKEVTVSESALNQAMKLFGDDAESFGINDGALGVCSVSENKIDVSSELLMKENIPSFEHPTPMISGAFGFSTASGKKLAVSESSLTKAKKLFAEDVHPLGGGNDLGVSIAGGEKKLNVLKPKMLLSCEDSTPVRSGAVRFSTASGKKVTVSEGSLNKANKLFAEDAESLEVNDVLSDISLAKGKQVDISAKSLLKANMISSKDSTPLRVEFVGFSSASGKKVSVSEKSVAHAKKLFSEDAASLIVDDNELSLSTPSGNNFVVSAMENISSCEDSTPARAGISGFASASGKKVSISEKSLTQAKQLFYEELNSICVNPGPSSAIHSCTHPTKSTQKEHPLIHPLMQMNKETKLPTPSEISKSPKLNNTNSHSLSNEQSDYLIIQADEIASYIENAKSLATLSSSNQSSNIKKYIDSGSHISPCKNEPSFCKPKEPNIGLDLKYDGIREQCITPTQDVFFSESQGDDYIKAVDMTVLNSPNIPMVDENPPSPVFRTTKKRRLKMKRIGIKRKVVGGMGDQTQSKFGGNTSIGNVSDGLSGESDSLKSSQSLLLTEEQECSEKGKHSDLWGGDIADESWLGKQLELAEESSLGVKFHEDTDHWAERRKIQGETICSKENVKPIKGHYLQVRRGLGQQRCSLREFVKGKRPGQYSKDELRKFGIQEETLNITSKNAADFKFKLQNYSKELPRGDGVLVKDGFRLIPNAKGIFGVTEAQSALLAGPGTDPNLLPTGDWCCNHYRWIIWKLASYEKSFPQEFGGRCLTPENLMCQLKYRWDREIDHGERSAIRKILEKDDTASKRMTLCVSDIKKPAMPASSKKLELDLIANSSLLELTDGWYCINGIVDSELARLVRSGSLTIGTKIVTSGAELINGPPNGCSPLEPLASAARIRLSANSTRRVRWDAKLGYVCSCPGPLPVSLQSLLPGGGAIGVLSNVLLARVYPILSIEKTLDGRNVVRSKRAEARAVAKYEFERQAWLESVYAEVSGEMQRELEEEARKRRGKRDLPNGSDSGRSFKHPRRSQSVYGSSRKSKILSPQGETVPVEELSRLVDESGDPSEVQNLLTASQVDMLNTYRQESRENFQKELEERVKRKIKQYEEKLISSNENRDSICAGGYSSSARKNREVVNLLKVRLVDADQPVIAKSAVLTIWRPSEDVISFFAKEGTILNIYGLTANGMRSNFIQMSSGKNTKYKLKKSQTHTAHLMESAYSSLRREILSRGFDDYQFNSAPDCNSSLPPFGEIDLVAMVIRVGEEPDRDKGHGFQHVHVAGSDGSLLSIAFWGGIQEFAVEEFLCPGSIVIALNLQWRRLHGLHRIATAQAVETSMFTLNPVEERLKVARKNFIDEIETEKQLQLPGAEFIQSCEQKLDIVLGIKCKEVSDSSNVRGRTSAGSKLPLPPISVSTSAEKICTIRPSVAARMKKLQMYEGYAEIQLPVCHFKNSKSVIKAFHHPKKCPNSSTSLSNHSKMAETVPVRCQSPSSLYSEVKTTNVSVSENKICQFSDADSPPMSLNSDSQE